jgi:hypothetical protein
VPQVLLAAHVPEHTIIRMRPLISVADLVVMSAAAGVCFLPAGQSNLIRCTLAVIAANAAFFAYRLLRPTMAPQLSRH